MYSPRRLAGDVNADSRIARAEYSMSRSRSPPTRVVASTRPRAGACICQLIYGRLSIRALVVRFTDGGEQIRRTLLITLTNRFERDRGGYEGRIRWYGGTAMSTDELIVQGFEWLVDYSQNYAENCAMVAAAARRGLGSHSNRASATEARQHQLTGQHLQEDSR